MTNIYCFVNAQITKFSINFEFMRVKYYIFKISIYNLAKNSKYAIYLFNNFLK